jgi:hypothetical protein
MFVKYFWRNLPRIQLRNILIRYCGVLTPCESCWDAEVCQRGDYATIREAVFSLCRAAPHRIRCLATGWHVTILYELIFSLCWKPRLWCCGSWHHIVWYMDTNVLEKYTFSVFLVEKMLKKWAEKDQWFLESDNLYYNNSYSACFYTYVRAIYLLSTIQFTTCYTYVDSCQKSCVARMQRLLRCCLYPLASFHTASTKALLLVLCNNLLLGKY